MGMVDIAVNAVVLVLNVVTAMIIYYFIIYSSKEVYGRIPHRIAMFVIIAWLLLQAMDCALALFGATANTFNMQEYAWVLKDASIWIITFSVLKHYCSVHVGKQDHPQR